MSQGKQEANTALKAFVGAGKKFWETEKKNKALLQKGEEGRILEERMT